MQENKVWASRALLCGRLGKANRRMVRDNPRHALVSEGVLLSLRSFSGGLW